MGSQKLNLGISGSKNRVSSGPRFHLTQAGLQWSGISFGHCFPGDFWDFSRKVVAFFGTLLAATYPDLTEGGWG